MDGWPWKQVGREGFNPFPKPARQLAHAGREGCIEEVRLSLGVTLLCRANDPPGADKTQRHNAMPSTDHLGYIAAAFAVTNCPTRLIGCFQGRCRGGLGGHVHPTFFQRVFLGLSRYGA